MTYPTWHTNPGNIARTSAIIKTLASWYSGQTDVVTGIAPLNEPAGFYGTDVLNAVRQYWYDSYGNIRYPYGSPQQGPLVEVIHDSFQTLDYWRGFETTGYVGVMMGS
jgi:glucan 1,3-beta-glucosidase